MAREDLNADFGAAALMQTEAMEWVQSPSPTVWRKRLELSGPTEAGRVTSVVRYDPESSFPAHNHPGGEEILVLDGVFSDEHGDWPAGTFLLNPEGFSHTPFSREGCVSFVKLRQYRGSEHVVIDTKTAAWQPAGLPGAEVLPLYEGEGEKIFLFRAPPGCDSPAHDHPGGEELFVIEGSLTDEHGTYRKGDWVRSPVGSRHDPVSEDGLLAYVKVGHLAGL
jgi:anti-sigma factor ChrR (cupin superfamily)